MSTPRWHVPALILITACGSGTSPTADTTTGSSTSAREPDTSASAGVSTDRTSGEGSTAAAESTEAASDDSCGFLDCGPPGPFQCSTIEDTCPPGEKCNVYADDGGNSWNASKCFPVVERPDEVDAACTAEGSPFSGLDSCERGSLCIWIDAETGLGRCTPFCSGSDNVPVCEDPARECTGGNTVLLCPPPCSPLDPYTCGEGEGCYPRDDHFSCAPDASGRGGTPLSPCRFINGCDAGSMCATAETVGACPPDAATCCTPFCDMADPVCPDGTLCSPYFAKGDAPRMHANLGLCGADPE